MFLGTLQYDQIMYRSLHDALTQVSSSDIIIAEDVSANGKKNSTLGLPDLDEKYKNMSKRHWYEVILENRPTRIFLDIESETHVSVMSIVEFFQKPFNICLVSQQRQISLIRVVMKNILGMLSFQI